MPSAIDHIESLSPWPKAFGLGTMHALLAELGQPQLAYPAVHVVGTNGKSTTTRMVEALLAAEGLVVGAYLSPHVSGWSERIRVGAREAAFEPAIERVRPAAEALGATQFETLTAAALTAFAEAEVGVAVVEAGLGGRLDATNVLRSSVCVLTNVSLEHTEVLGRTREAIAAEKLAVVRPGSTVVLGEAEWEALALARGAERVVVEPGGNLAVARAAAEAFLGRPVDPAPAASVRLPGRLEVRGERPLELWDGAHTPAGADYLLEHLPERRFVVCVAFLGDKDVDGVLVRLARVADRLVATASTSPRALPVQELAVRAENVFHSVDALQDPHAALALARELAGRSGAVLVTGSLSLLADLAVRAKDVPSPARG